MTRWSNFQRINGADQRKSSVMRARRMLRVGAPALCRQVLVAIRHEHDRVNWSTAT
jgi:hypothetical protein